MTVYIPMTQGDSLIPIDFTITDSTGTPIDLTNTSNNKFKMSLPNSNVDKTNSSTTVQSAQGGVLRYTFTKADLDTVNVSGYLAEIELVYLAGNASGRVVTVGDVPPNNIVVQVYAQRPQ